MGLFDVFKKKDCEICGKEVGLLGYKKLEDGEICKDCVKLLSPWFEDRRHATVAQIKEQLVYREQNRENLKNFQITRTIGDYEKIHIEEVNGVPTRFFVTQFGEGMEDNPDIVSFRDVVSCVLDLDVHDEELMQKDKEGNRVSYNPPRFQHHYNFIIRMEIRNNPYFDEIYFTVNSDVVTLETVGGVGGGIGGAALSGLLKGAGITPVSTQAASHTNFREQRRYNEYQMMCDKIIQVVEDGKRGAAAAPVAQSVDLQSILAKIDKINHAPDLLTAVTVGAEVARLITSLSDPDWDRVKKLNEEAVAEAKLRFGYQEPSNAPVQEAPKPKFCPNCGAPFEGGKFCQHCGSKL